MHELPPLENRHLLWVASTPPLALDTAHAGKVHIAPPSITMPKHPSSRICSRHTRQTFEGTSSPHPRPGDKFCSSPNFLPRTVLRPYSVIPSETLLPPASTQPFSPKIRSCGEPLKHAEGHDQGKSYWRLKKKKNIMRP